MSVVQASVRRHIMRERALSSCIALVLAAACDPSSFEASDRRTADENSLNPSGDAGQPALAPAPPQDAGASSLDASPEDARDTVDADGSAMLDADEPPRNMPDAMSMELERDAASTPPPMCMDTVRDAKNCGECGNDCTASGAVVSCQNSRCIRSCAPEYRDCNGNLSHGGAMDGCERRVDNDADNCGECNKRCKPPEGGFAICSASRCTGHTLRNDFVSMGLLHGTVSGGGPFRISCGPGEVVTGLRGLGEKDKVWSVQLACAQLKLSRSRESGALTVTTAPRPASASTTTNLDWKPPDYVLTCPPNSVVTSLAGATHRWNMSADASVSRLAIVCSTITLTSDLKKIAIAAGQMLSIGAEDATALVERFSDPCGETGVLQGIDGRNGAYLDAVATMCGRLSVREEIVGSEQSANGASAAVSQ